MSKQFKANIKLLKHLHGSQILLLSLLEERCEIFPRNLKDVPAVLMLLYENEMLDEDTICSWYSKGNSKLFSLTGQKSSEETRKAASKLVAWLKTADKESDE